MSVTLTYSRSYLMLVFITSSWWSSSSGTEPLIGMLPQPRDYIRWYFADPAIAARPHDVRFTPESGHSAQTAAFNESGRGKVESRKNFTHTTTAKSVAQL
jgi:hypothetical protein